MLSRRQRTDAATGAGEIVASHEIFVVVHPDFAKVKRVRAVMDFFVEVISRDASVLQG